MVEQFEDKACRVQKAGNVAAALRRVRQQKPDLIFVDIMMPVMDGFDLIAELQENLETRDVPVVLETTVSTPNVTLTAIDLGVKYLLTKPWEQSQLDFVFEQALNLESGESSTTARQR